MEKLKYLLSLTLLSLPAYFSAQQASAQDEDAWEEAGEPEAAPAEETAPAEEVSEPIEAEEPPAAAEEEAEESSPFDGFTFSGFVDAFYNFKWNHLSDVRPEVPSHTAFVNRNNGFALSFLALNLGYSGDNFGFTTDFRFGPSTPYLMGDIGDTFPISYDGTAIAEDEDGNPVQVNQVSGGGTGLSLENVKQAFATWTPTDSFTLDFGQFDTIYGAEVADSFANLNYTRGALYFLMQPFYHTGLRASYSVTDEFGLTALITNGFNSPVTALKGNMSPGIGLQASYAPSDAFSAYLGYFTLSGDEENEDWDHFIDLVVNAGFGDFSLVFNGDLWYTAADSVYYGLSLALGYQVTDMFAIALREEFLHDPDNASFGDVEGAEDVILTTTTLTLRVIPTDNLVFSLDNRLETSTEEVFASGESDFTKTQFTTAIGMVVKTD